MEQVTININYEGKISERISWKEIIRDIILPELEKAKNSDIQPLAPGAYIIEGIDITTHIPGTLRDPAKMSTDLKSCSENCLRSIVCKHYPIIKEQVYQISGHPGHISIEYRRIMDMVFCKCGYREEE